MRRIRVIPILLLQNRKLVKTIRFKSPQYIGDPINALRILNEKEVDEIVILDIAATRENKAPDLPFIKSLASECFMPISYGGGITDVQQANEILRAGIEKIVIGAIAFKKPEIISELAKTFGSSSVVVSMDIKYNFLNRPSAFIVNGQKKIPEDLLKLARDFEKRGAGEIMLQTIDKDGTQSGYDLSAIKTISSALTIPVIAGGGAQTINDFLLAVTNGASAVAAGAMFVFRGPHKAVLINYPTQHDLTENLYKKL